MLKWCLPEARDLNLKEEDFMGGFVLDEMKIQVHISLQYKKNLHICIWNIQENELFCLTYDLIYM